MKFLTNLFGDPNEKIIKKIAPLIEEINSFGDHFKNKTDEELARTTKHFIDNCPKTDDINQINEYLDSIMTRAFALVREASTRVLGQRHYDVQLIGGVILHRGQITEMKTGEGKTLVATLPLFLNALAGRGVHLVTVNDYLARVGAGWMAPVFHFLGLSTGVITNQQTYIYDPNHADQNQFDERLKHFRPCTRKESYEAHITYGTNNEFGFDFLRDNMVSKLDLMVQRPLHFAIVDEIDSILIDEARTPLIISAPAQKPTEKYYQFAKLVAQLKENEDYNVDEKSRSAILTDAGIRNMEKALGVDNIYTVGGVREVHHIEQALKAHVLFSSDKDYVVRDGQVIIIDEFTGRMMEGRRFSDGLHQAIEAKEGVEIKRESQTLATITFQNYFRMYSKLSGMTGTALTEAEEFSKIYNLEVVSIPTHRPVLRADKNDLIYPSEQGKINAIIKDTKKRIEAGQPVLIGTVSIEKNEELSLSMERAGIKAQVLNAKNHEKEAEIIADAGKVGAVTIATNMAGRGVDIMLGGVEPEKGTEEHKAWQVRHDEIIRLGGLHVVGTERHESRRIDNQLRGRAGRQGDPGSSQFFLSTDDDLMRIFGGDRMRNIMKTLKLPEDTPIENKIISKSIEGAQKKVEGNNFDVRKHLVEFDDVINKHREAIYARRKNLLKISESEARENSLHPITTEMLGLLKTEINFFVDFHSNGEDTTVWNVVEISEITKSLFKAPENLRDELNIIVNNYQKDSKEAKTRIKDYIFKLANERYEEMVARAKRNSINWVAVETSVMLRAIDIMWIEHLSTMASLRQGIGLRGYGQRDPLLEYKKEAFRLYGELESLIRRETVFNILKLGELEHIVAPNTAERAEEFSGPDKTAPKKQPTLTVTQKPATPPDKIETPMTKGIEQSQANQEPATNKKVGRNEKCPCGSGKKFKKCCGK